MYDVKVYMLGNTNWSACICVEEPCMELWETEDGETFTTIISVNVIPSEYMP